MEKLCGVDNNKCCCTRQHIFLVCKQTHMLINGAPVNELGFVPSFSNVSEVSSIFTCSSRFAKKVRVQKHPQKESSPTTHVTETSFLNILDPPDNFGTNYIFDHFFTHIHNLDFVFFNSRVSSIFTFSSRFAQNNYRYG